MIRTRDILIAYATVDNRLGERFDAARTSATRDFWLNVRILNAHAYFMLIFGRFEKHIVDKSAALVTRRKNAAHWKRRRAWKDLNPRRLGFMQRVALLTDPSKNSYARVHDIYKNTRCPIAHGDSLIVGLIVLPVLAEELRTLSSELSG